MNTLFSTKINNYRIAFLLILSFFITTAFKCQAQSTGVTMPVNKVIVKDVKQVSEYTYLLVNKDSLGVLLQDTLWIALPKMEASAGDTFYYTGGFFMYDLKSRDLNRTFKKVLFLQKISKTAIAEEKVTMPDNPHATATADTNKYAKPATVKISITIEPVKGGITIADLFGNKAIYSGDTVKIKGKVTKFSSGIMDKNWIHLQDGTEYKGKYDLTITTNDEVTTGDIITIEGKISLEKNFGFGYSYEVIMEDAKIAK
jgi:hypothetical protein